MIGEIKVNNSFTLSEDFALERFCSGALDDMPLSGYLAGKARGGKAVCCLEEAWAETFKVKHAIAVNSATSGLHAAAIAIGLKPGDKFACPAMTMSATAAAPMATGAIPIFIDVEDTTFGLYAGDLPYDVPAFATNLFGHPASLKSLRKWCDANGTFLIEDNAQSPFAMQDGKYAGTIGHIGVFSLNVHKPLQSGEGGIVVTDDDALAEKMRNFINHGENTGGPIGLNLRMSELCAVVALTQLQRARAIINERIEQAEAIVSVIGDIPGLRLPIVRAGSKHVYYTIPLLLEKNRDDFIFELDRQGVPIVCGYVGPLYRLPAFAPYARPCPVAEDLHDRRLFYIENCRYTFTAEQIKLIGEAFKRAAEAVL